MPIHKRKFNSSYGNKFAGIDPITELSESVALLEQATEANQRQISVLSANMETGFKEITILMERQVTESRVELKSLAQEFSRSKQTNWPLLVALFGLVAMLLGGAYKISDLQTQVTMSPVVASSIASQQDRSEMHNQITDNRNDIAAEKIERKIIATKLIEIETQFRAADQSRNVQFAEQQRMNNIIFQLINSGAKGIFYPLNPYYFPSISGNPPEGNGNSPR